jgi:hypothetical protein
LEIFGRAPVSHDIAVKLIEVGLFESWPRGNRELRKNMRVPKIGMDVPLCDREKER